MLEVNRECLKIFLVSGQIKYCSEMWKQRPEETPKSLIIHPSKSQEHLGGVKKGEGSFALCAFSILFLYYLNKNISSFNQFCEGIE